MIKGCLEDVQACQWVGESLVEIDNPFALRFPTHGSQAEPQKKKTKLVFAENVRLIFFGFFQAPIEYILLLASCCL
jgi:hypothetical protein